MRDPLSVISLRSQMVGKLAERAGRFRRYLLTSNAGSEFFGIGKDGAQQLTFCRVR